MPARAETKTPTELICAQSRAYLCGFGLGPQCHEILRCDVQLFQSRIPLVSRVLRIQSHIAAEVAACGLINPRAILFFMDIPLFCQMSRMMTDWDFVGEPARRRGKQRRQYFRE